MEELKAVIASTVDTYFVVEPKNAKRAYDDLAASVEAVFKAYGACNYCEGRGYRIVTKGVDYALESPSEGLTTTVEVCVCDRGLQLSSARNLPWEK